MVVRVALANLVFASPSSMPLLLVGELGCEHNSSSERPNERPLQIYSRVAISRAWS